MSSARRAVAAGAVVATALVAWSTYAGAQTLPVPITAPHTDLSLEPNVESDGGSNPPVPGQTLTLPFAVDLGIGLPEAPADPGSPPPDSETMAADDSTSLEVAANGCVAGALLSSRAPDGCNVPTAGVATPAQVDGTGGICIDGTLATVPIGACSEIDADGDAPGLPVDPDDPGPSGEPLSPLCDVPIVGEILADLVCPESVPTPPSITPATPTNGVETPGAGSPFPPGGGGGGGAGSGAPIASAAGDDAPLTGSLPFTGSTGGRLALVGAALTGLGLAVRRSSRFRSLFTS